MRVSALLKQLGLGLWLFHVAIQPGGRGKCGVRKINTAKLAIVV